MFDKYPYTDFHELNLDWFLAQFKTLTDAWDSQQANYEQFKEDVTTEFNNLSGKFDTLEETVQSFTRFITNYFDNLDVQEEINNKLDELVANGTMTELIRPIFDAYAAQMTQRMNVLEGRMDTFASLPEGSTSGNAELLDIRVGGNGVTYSSAGNAVRAQYNLTQTDINFIESYVIEESGDVLPGFVKGNFRFVKEDNSDLMISGTYNVAELFNLRQGTFVINGVTITVNGNTITMNGTPSADFNYSFVDGSAKTSTELMAMTLPIPVHLYTASQKILNGSVFPAILSRGKTSGNAFVAQNNTAVFTMDPSTYGGLYSYMQASKTYDCTFVIGLFPFVVDNNYKYRDQESDVTVYNTNGIYALNGYSWFIGNPTITELKSKLPKKCLCKYSTRTIDYSSMSKCIDIYVPTRAGYINYVMGYVNKPADYADIWRLIQVDAVNDALEYKYHITQQGETEMALMINGRDDFVGGSIHGDEIMIADSLVCVIDGKITDPESITELTKFKTFQMFLVSNLYDPADHSTLIGVHGREWMFDESGLTLSQTVEFKTDLTLGGSYMPMLCVIRGNDQVSDMQISDTYIDDGNFMPYDVGVAGFTTYPNQLKKVSNIYLLGRESGIESSLELVSQPENLRGEGSFVYNGANTYNKIYCCICGYGGGSNLQNVSTGDKWEVKSKINFEVN